jgi:UDP-N-acetylglucosamine acyltransferase
MGTFIHDTAIVDDGAEIGSGSYVGPFCCVGRDVVLGERVRLESHVVITGRTVIGNDSSVFPFASLGQIPQDLKYKGEESRLEIGSGVTIREYVTANTGTCGGGMLTKIGDKCLVMAYCHIAHDCIVGDNVIMSNAVNLSGHVNVGDNAVIGGVSAVKQFVRIGEHAMIGGGTVLDHDVIPYGVVASDRAFRVKGINIIGLKRHGFKNEEIELLLMAFRDIFESEGGRDCFTENLKVVREKYTGNSRVSQIIDFIQTPSKNPIKA